MSTVFVEGEPDPDQIDLKKLDSPSTPSPSKESCFKSIGDIIDSTDDSSRLNSYSSTSTSTEASKIVASSNERGLNFPACVAAAPLSLSTPEELTTSFNHTSTSSVKNEAIAQPEVDEKTAGNCPNNKTETVVECNLPFSRKNSNDGTNEAFDSVKNQPDRGDIDADLETSLQKFNRLFPLDVDELLNLVSSESSGGNEKIEEGNEGGGGEGMEILDLDDPVTTDRRLLELVNSIAESLPKHSHSTGSGFGTSTTCSLERSDSWEFTPYRSGGSLSSRKSTLTSSLSREDSTGDRDSLSTSSSSLLSVESLAQFDSLLQWLARGNYLSTIGGNKAAVDRSSLAASVSEKKNYLPPLAPSIPERRRLNCRRESRRSMRCQRPTKEDARLLQRSRSISDFDYGPRTETDRRMEELEPEQDDPKEDAAGSGVADLESPSHETLSNSRAPSNAGRLPSSNKSCLSRIRSESFHRRHSFSSLDDNNEDIDWSWLDEIMDSNGSSWQQDASNSFFGRLPPPAPEAAPAPTWILDDQQQSSTASSATSTPSTVPPTPIALATPTLSPLDPSRLISAGNQTQPPPPLTPSAPEMTSRGNSSTWLRESMRRVRHFRLSEPSPIHSAPLPSSPIRVVDEYNAPVFPCEILERPTSAPVERPRQYGRRHSRPISSSSNVSLTGDSGLGSSHPDETLPPISIAMTEEEDPVTAVASIREQLRIAPSAPPCEDPGHGDADFSSSGDSSSDDSESPPPSAEQDCDPVSIVRAYEMPQNSMSPQGQWSHGLSSMLACLGCTLGLFNISRFAILSIHFGANFIIQFAILSLIVGVPLFTFHVSIGQLLASGVIDMWTISPIFKGIGVALLLSQAMLGIYSIIGISWMFVYFRDSFITKQDVYRWAEPLDISREDGLPDIHRNNITYKLEETVPDYFNGIVLQRQYLNSPPSDSGSIKFSVAFNLAVAWLIIFISLSKGLKSYGKVIYVFSVFPVVGLFILCAKMLGAAPIMSQNSDFFLETDWSEFFLNTKSWTAAFVESFATWGMLGASVMQLASHNKQKNLLPRDTGLVIIITLAVLILSSFLAHTCYQLILAHGFVYSPSSFEQMSTYRFLYRLNSPQPSSHFSTRVQWMAHSGFFVGERVINPSINPRHESGYQALRFATELVPATFALLGADKVSPFWSVLFYFVLTLFGIAQQLAIWHCVISGIVAIDVKTLKPWLTTITFFTCVLAFIIGLPMCSELGIFVVYYLDFCIGSAWWLVLLYLLEIGAVFMVRGRPYSGETVVATLFSHTSQILQSWVAPMLSFIWNVILPVALMLLSTTIIKNGGYKVLYNWQVPGYDYWPPWGRQAGCLIQLIPLIIVPLVGIIQTCRYLTAGPPDIFERIQLLYRPRIDPQQNIHDMSVQTNLDNSGNGNGIPNEDPPPKYTPPPSYSTATGARIAKLFRQSLRRSVRGIRHIRSVLGAQGDNRDAYDVSNPPGSPQRPPPPNYAAVLVEINQSQSGNGISNRTQTTIPRRESEVNEVIRRSNFAASEVNPQSRNSTMTATDVANILRSSLRRTVLRSNSMSSQVSSSVEHLVRNAAPINHDSLVLDVENIKTNSQQNTIN